VLKEGLFPVRCGVQVEDIFTHIVMRISHDVLQLGQLVICTLQGAIGDQFAAAPSL